MPERSSTSPISVKNGTASSVSLAMMPNTRCGSAWNSAGVSRPSSMPISPYRMPLAASAKATGKPSSRNTTRVANMMGARLAMKKSISTPPVARLRRRGQRRGFAGLCLARDFLGQFLLGRARAFAPQRVLAAAQQETHAFDQVRDAGQHQQREARRDQQLHGPAHQPTRIGGLLVGQATTR